jgi:hypothetical protein
MAFNHRYWRPVFMQEFCPQLRAIVDALDNRVLPGFEGIELEAETHSDALWKQGNSTPASGDEDLSELADAATQVGVNHYLLLDGIRQGIVNLFAASLYHAFEQQLMLFHRREVLLETEQNAAELFKASEFRKRLAGSTSRNSPRGEQSMNCDSSPTRSSTRKVNRRKHFTGCAPIISGKPGCPEWETGSYDGSR